MHKKASVKETQDIFGGDGYISYPEGGDGIEGVTNARGHQLCVH
jgi:hypothetical protein